MNNEFQFTLTGTSNAAYVVEASTNLQTWFTVRTNEEAVATRVLRVPAVGPKCFYRARTAIPLFGFAIATRETIDMNGNNILVDSFDSSDPIFSTNGRYDVLKRKDGGDIASNSGLTNSINVGNARIYGRVLSGSNGSATIGPSGAVGSLAWHAASRTGIEPGWWRNDLSMTFAHVNAPGPGGFTPADGDVAGEYYDYVLQSGRYQMASLRLSSVERMYVDGDAELFVTSEFDISGNAYIEIGSGSSLRLYVGSPYAVIGGNGIVNHGGASQFIYYGLPANRELTIASNGAFVGAVYAPQTDLRLYGGSSSIFDFIGAAVCKGAILGGHLKFHYDEALRNVPSLVF